MDLKRSQSDMAFSAIFDGAQLQTQKRDLCAGETSRFDEVLFRGFFSL
jgi:hypothetical protein